MNALEKVEQSQLRKDVTPFRPGDTVKVHVKIKEGEKERIQMFTGTVVCRRGSGISETFTVRRIVNNEGVERVFPVHTPRIASIEIVRSGRVRRAKLYYLRDRVGKSQRLKEHKAAVEVPGETEVVAEASAQETAAPEKA